MSMLDLKPLDFFWDHVQQLRWNFSAETSLTLA